MMGGGHLCGYLLGKEEKKRIEKALTFLADPKCFADKYHVKDRPVLLFAEMAIIHLQLLKHTMNS